MAMLKARAVRVLPSTERTAAPRLSQTNPFGKPRRKNSAGKVSACNNASSGVACR